MAKSWHRKHISTKWGIAILGLLLFGVVLTISVHGQNQDLRSQAAIKTPPKVYFSKQNSFAKLNNRVDIPIFIDNPARSTVTNMRLKIYYSQDFKFIEFIPNQSLSRSMKTESRLTGDLSYKQHILLNIDLVGLTSSTEIGTLRFIATSIDKQYHAIVYILPESKLQLNNSGTYTQATAKNKRDYVYINILKQHGLLEE